VRPLGRARPHDAARRAAHVIAHDNRGRPIRDCPDPTVPGLHRTLAFAKRSADRGLRWACDGPRRAPRRDKRRLPLSRTSSTLTTTGSDAGHCPLRSRRSSERITPHLSNLAPLVRRRGATVPADDLRASRSSGGGPCPREARSFNSEADRRYSSLSDARMKPAGPPRSAGLLLVRRSNG
jgi:hypothetical protein